MSELFNQLGVNWRLLLSQGVNFLILLVALTFLVYKPLLKVMAERKKRIEAGLADADEAERKLKNIGNLEAERMAKVEKDALAVIKKAESNAQLSAKSIVFIAEGRAVAVLKEAAEIASKKRMEDLENLKEEGAGLIREAILRTVELDPRAVDEKLISKALAQLSANEI